MFYFGNVIFVFVEDCKCGKSKYEDAGKVGGSVPQGNIVAGWAARPHEFPWQVNIDLYRTAVIKHQLTGVLDSPP